MTSYKPPMKDIEFLLKDVLHAEERTKDIEAYKAVDWEGSKMIFDAVSDFATKIAMPLNAKGDAEGCHFNPEDSSVKTPKGLKEAYDEFRNMGMIGLNGSAQYGGSDMPQYVGAVMKLMLSATNFPFAMYPGLTSGQAKVFEVFATDELKQKFLPLLYSGEMTGTMCLTEPNAGSSLDEVKTMAQPQADGTYLVTGQKIFISGGEHDLSPNISHLVLARLPGAPAGKDGISLFAVPKNDLDTGAPNGVKCGGIEHKMGIHASSTCTMNFDNAKGWMIGKENEGLKAMFVMMNFARVGVAGQAAGMADFVLQNTEEFSDIRIQGKQVSQSFNKNAKAVPISWHANTQRDLLEMRAETEGFIALMMDASIELDVAERHSDAAKRAASDLYVSQMNNVLKACMTDMACSTALKGIQMHGGMGFITETGIEQFLRDSVIGTIYEGTNDIHAKEFTFAKALRPKKSPSAKKSNGPKKSPIPTKGLMGAFARTSLGRKYIEGKIAAKVDPRKPGAPLEAFGVPLMAEIAAAKKNPALKCQAEMLEHAMDSFSHTVGKMAVKMVEGNFDEVLIHSRDFMNMYSKVAVGRMWLKMMTVASDKLATGAKGDDKLFYEKKMESGDCYMTRIMLPDVHRFEDRILGKGSADAIMKALNRKTQP